MGFINRHKQFYSVGVDIFKPYLSEARKQKIHDDYVLCDIRKIPIKGETFDIILCLEVLEHLEKENSHQLLGEMERIVTRQVIISTPLAKYEQKPYDGNLYKSINIFGAQMSLRHWAIRLRL